MSDRNSRIWICFNNHYNKFNVLDRAHILTSDCTQRRGHQNCVFEQSETKRLFIKLRADISNDYRKNRNTCKLELFK